MTQRSPSRWPSCHAWKRPTLRAAGQWRTQPRSGRALHRCRLALLRAMLLRRGKVPFGQTLTRWAARVVAAPAPAPARARERWTHALHPAGLTLTLQSLRRATPGKQAGRGRSDTCAARCAGSFWQAQAKGVHRKVAKLWQLPTHAGQTRWAAWCDAVCQPSRTHAHGRPVRLSPPTDAARAQEVEQWGEREWESALSGAASAEAVAAAACYAAVVWDWPKLRGLLAAAERAPQEAAAAATAAAAAGSARAWSRAPAAARRMMLLEALALGLQHPSRARASPLAAVASASAASRLGSDTAATTAAAAFCVHVNLPSLLTYALAAGPAGDWEPTTRSSASAEFSGSAAPRWAAWLQLAQRNVCSAACLLANATHTLGLARSGTAGSSSRGGTGGAAATLLCMRDLLPEHAPMAVAALLLKVDAGEPLQPALWLGSSEVAIHGAWVSLMSALAAALRLYPTAAAAARHVVALLCADAAAGDAQSPVGALTGSVPLQRLLQPAPPAIVAARLAVSQTELPRTPCAAPHAGLLERPVSCSLVEGMRLAAMARDVAAAEAASAGVRSFHCAEVVRGACAALQLLGLSVVARRVWAASAALLIIHETAGRLAEPGAAVRVHLKQQSAAAGAHALASTLAHAEAARDDGARKSAAAAVAGALCQTLAAHAARSDAEHPADQQQQQQQQRRQWASTLQWALVPALLAAYCCAESEQAPPLLLVHAADGDWVALLRDAQLLGTPAAAVRVAASALPSSPLAAHVATVVARAVEDCESAQQRRQKSAAAARLPLTTVLGTAERSASPGTTLLAAARALRWPLLAVAAACHPDASVPACLACWLEAVAAICDGGDSSTLAPAPAPQAVAAAMRHGEHARVSAALSLFVPSSGLVYVVAGLAAAAVGDYAGASRELATTGRAPLTGWEADAAAAAVEAVLLTLPGRAARDAILRVLAASRAAHGSWLQALLASAQALGPRALQRGRLTNAAAATDGESVLQELLEERRWDEAHAWVATRGAPGDPWRVTAAEATAVVQDVQLAGVDDVALPWAAADAVMRERRASAGDAGRFFRDALQARWGSKGGATEGGVNDAKEAAVLARLAHDWLSGAAGGGPAPAVPAAELELLQLRAELAGAAAKSGAADGDEAALLALADGGHMRLATACAAVLGLAPLPLAAVQGAMALARGTAVREALTPELAAALQARGVWLTDSDIDAAAVAIALGALCPPRGGREACERAACALLAAGALGRPVAEMAVAAPEALLRLLCMLPRRAAAPVVTRAVAAHGTPPAVVATVLADAFARGMLADQHSASLPADGASASGDEESRWWKPEVFDDWAQALLPNSAHAVSEALLAATLQHSALPPAGEATMLALAVRYGGRAAADGSGDGRGAGALLSHCASRAAAMAGAGEWRAVARLVAGAGVPPALDAVVARLLAATRSATALLAEMQQWQVAPAVLARAAAAAEIAEAFPAEGSDGAAEPPWVQPLETQLGLAASMAARQRRRAASSYVAAASPEAAAAAATDTLLLVAMGDACDAAAASAAAGAPRAAAACAALAELCAAELGGAALCAAPLCRPAVRQAVLSGRPLHSSAASRALLLAAAAELRDAPAPAHGPAVWAAVACNAPAAADQGHVDVAVAAMIAVMEVFASAASEAPAAAAHAYGIVDDHDAHDSAPYACAVASARRAAAGSAAAAQRWRVFLRVVAATGRDYALVARARWHFAFALVRQQRRRR